MRDDDAVEAAAACDCISLLASGEVSEDADECCDGQGGREMEARTHVAGILGLVRPRVLQCTLEHQRASVVIAADAALEVRFVLHMV